MTLGYGAMFFVILPILVTGLVIYAVAQALGERAENQRRPNRWRRRRAGED